MALASQKLIKQKLEEHIENLRNKKRLEEIKQQEEQEKRKDRLERKRKKEERWEMAKWVHAYIEDNNKEWEKTRIRRIE